MAGKRAAVAGVRSIVAVFREFEQAARGANLSLAQYRLLLFLRVGPRRAGEIAAMMLVTPGTLSPQLAALRDRGLIDADNPADDRRVSRLALTPLGRSEMNQFESRLAGCLNGLAGDDPLILDGLSALYVALGDTRESRFESLGTPGSGT
jgi:DNA-binding MarR family transcriptional regulator